jgi:hypothetical protein
VGSRILTQARRLAKPSNAKPIERPKNIPKDWIKTSSEKGEGIKYVDPNNKGTYVRIQRGEPNSPYPHQRVDYVRWQRNGVSLDVNGNPVSKYSPEAHILLKDFKFNPELFK